MLALHIRQATPGDASVLATIGRKTFYEKWKNTTSAENMQQYLNEAYNDKKVRDEIADSSIIYLLAEEGKDAVGFAKMMHTHPDIEVPEPDVSFTQENPLEISRIYVMPELIGKSIGAALMENIFAIAEKEHCDLIWLGVWEHNPAVKFYLRHGFVKAGTHKFILGDQVDTDWVMVKQI